MLDGTLNWFGLEGAGDSGVDAVRHTTRLWLIKYRTSPPQASVAREMDPAEPDPGLL